MDDDAAFPPGARWIWSAAPAADAWWILRTVVALPGDCRAPRLRITAAYQYVLYVDGALAARGPALSFDFAKACDEVDLAPHLRPGGRHVLTILAPSHPTLERQGVLAALTWDGGHGMHSLVTDRRWAVRRHHAFRAGTAGRIQGPALLLGREEWYDARHAPASWDAAWNGDDDGEPWTAARELGPPTMAPWTRLVPSGIGQLSDDPLPPRAITAIELARPRPGPRIRLVCPEAHIHALKVYATELTCDEATTVQVHCHAEVRLAGRLVHGRLELPAGTSLLTVCQRGYYTYETELLLETEAPLTWDAAALVPSSGNPRWALRVFTAGTVEFPWHESPATIPDPPELTALLAAPTVAAIPSAMRTEFTAARQEIGSVTLDVMTQRRAADGQDAVRDGQHLIQGHASATTVLPVTDHDVHLIVDFDREVVGHIEFQVDAPSGTVIDVQGFELMRPDGIAWMHHNGFRYVCREGLQGFTSHVRRGFRYLSLTIRGFARPVRIHQLRCRRSAFPVREFGAFSCSDPHLDRAWRMSVDTAALCMLDTYVDCPGHEQTFWVGDARITGLINLLTFGARDLDQRSLRLVGQSLSPAWAAERAADDPRRAGDGLPMAAYPDYPRGGLPLWALLWAEHCRDHWQLGGDRTDLAENHGYLVELVARFRRHRNARGLIDIPGAWNLIEWGGNDLSPCGEVTATNVMLVRCLRLVAEMAAALGLTGAAFSVEADALQAAVERHCWDAEHEAYVDTVRDGWAYDRYTALCATTGWAVRPWAEFSGGARISEQTNTLALLCGCVPPARRAAVERIVRRSAAGHYRPSSPAGRSPHPPGADEAPDGIVAIGSPFFLFFTLAALFRLGDDRLAIGLIRREWTRMADLGLRTCPESFGWPRSAAHAWSASPAVFLPMHVLGLRPLSPGWRTFTVQPCASDLTWARGAVATPHGPIQVQWQRHGDGRLEISCTAPDGCVRILECGTAVG